MCQCEKPPANEITEPLAFTVCKLELCWKAIADCRSHVPGETLHFIGWNSLVFFLFWSWLCFAFYPTTFLHSSWWWKDLVLKAWPRLSVKQKNGLWHLGDLLRWNPPEVRVTSGQKPSTKIIYIVLQTSVGLCTVLNIFSKNLISIATPKRRKWMLNFVWNTWMFWWNETDDGIFPVFAQNLWTLKFIFSHSHCKLFAVLLQAIIYVFRFKKM